MIPFHPLDMCNVSVLIVPPFSYTFNFAKPRTQEKFVLYCNCRLRHHTPHALHTPLSRASQPDFRGKYSYREVKYSSRVLQIKRLINGVKSTINNKSEGKRLKGMWKGERLTQQNILRVSVHPSPSRKPSTWYRTNTMKNHSNMPILMGASLGLQSTPFVGSSSSAHVCAY